MTPSSDTAFLRWYALRSRRPLRWLGVATLVTTIAFLPLDDTPRIFWTRAVIASVIAPGIAFYWFASETLWIRFWEPIATFNTIVILFGCFTIIGADASPAVLLYTGMIMAVIPSAAGFAACLRGRTTTFVSLIMLVGGSIAFGRLPQFGGSLLAGIVMILVVSGLAACLAAVQLERALRNEFDSTRKIEHERARADALLCNVLPSTIAERLKSSQGAIAERFPSATVLFADIVGFTPLTQKLPPERIVEILDKLFSAFDDLAEKHGLEKIKTIGDAYMVVGGVPVARADHAHAIAAMALEMSEVLARLTTEHATLRLRIGIDSGPVVAGVIGKRKFLYDLWGDTVNTASRMESHGVEGRVQVTENTYALLRDGFAFEARGSIDVKGKGTMTTYFLTGHAPRA